MVDLALAKAITDVATKLLKALGEVKIAKKDGHKLKNLIDLVTAVYANVRADGRRMAKNPNVILAMKSLKETLEEANVEVHKYLKSNIIIKTITVDDTIKKLASLRQEIDTLMLVSVQATVDETSMDVKDLKQTVGETRMEVRRIADTLSHAVPGKREELERGQTSGTVVVGNGKQPRVLTDKQLGNRQKKDTKSVADVLSIPFGVAAVLLRHLNWAPDRVQDEWFRNEKKLRKAVGLPPSGKMEIRERSDRKCKCNICFCTDKKIIKISAGCSHYSCKKCWNLYIKMAVGTGVQQCLSLRCPDPSCRMPVTQELVDKVVVKVSDRKRYAMFAKWSYVDDSGGRIKWCPGPDCGRAVEYLPGAKEDHMRAVACDLNHSFCWSCREEPHWPVSCDTARLWLDAIIVTKKEEECEAMASDHYKLWSANEASLKTMEDLLKGPDLVNLADGLRIPVAELDFLSQAYKEITECRRLIRWVYPYGQYHLDPKRDQDKCEHFNRLRNEANDSLERLQDSAEQDSLKLYHYQEQIIQGNMRPFQEAYTALKNKVTDMTRETRHEVEKLVRAV